MEFRVLKCETRSGRELFYAQQKVIEKTHIHFDVKEEEHWYTIEKGIDINKYSDNACHSLKEAVMRIEERIAYLNRVRLREVINEEVVYTREVPKY